MRPLLGRRAFGFLIAQTLVGNALAGQAPQVPFLSQQMPSWCWAAASEMVLRIIDPNGPFSQLAQAKQALGASCGNPTPSCGPLNPFYDGCDKPGFPSIARLGFKAETSPRPQSWAQLKLELDACRPVLFGWCSPNKCGSTPATSRGHWMVAAAADICSRPDGRSVPIVRVFNPAPCCQGKALWLPYSVYASGGAAMNFWQNHFAVRPEGEEAPTSAGSACRLTTEEVDPEMNFTIDEPGKPEDLVQEVVKGCLQPQHWLDSKLLRPPFTAELPQGDLAVDLPVRRRLVSLRNFAGLSPGFVGLKWQGLLGVDAPAKLLVFPVRIGQQPLVNVVLEENPPGRFTLQAIEDSEAAGALRDQLKHASQDPPGSVTQVVLFEVGVSLLSRTTSVVEVTSQTNCRQVAGAQKTRVVELQNLPAILEPLAAPFLAH